MGNIVLEVPPIPINIGTAGGPADVAKEPTVTIKEPADIVTESAAGFGPLKTILEVISTNPKVYIRTTLKLPL